MSDAFHPTTTLTCITEPERMLGAAAPEAVCTHLEPSGMTQSAHARRKKPMNQKTSGLKTLSSDSNDGQVALGQVTTTRTILRFLSKASWRPSESPPIGKNWLPVQRNFGRSVLGRSTLATKSNSSLQRPIDPAETGRTFSGLATIARMIGNRRTVNPCSSSAIWLMLWYSLTRVLQLVVYVQSIRSGNSVGRFRVKFCGRNAANMGHDFQNRAGTPHSRLFSFFRQAVGLQHVNDPVSVRLSKRLG